MLLIILSCFVNVNSYGISNNEELNFLKRLKREDRPGRLLKGQRTGQKYSQRNST